MSFPQAQWRPLNVPRARRRYQICILTGGIGSGLFFALDGDHTLGREESRSGRLLDHRDYCKLHIIAHYIRILVGDDFPVLPVGSVGDDQVGHRLLEEMGRTGMDLRYVYGLPSYCTLYSIVLVYPDGSGGNLTTNDSASSHVSVENVRATEPEFVAHGPRGIVIAAPEVPLLARQELLRLATVYGFFRCASFTTEEIRQAADSGLLDSVDLLAINCDEAARLAGVSPELPPLQIVEAAVSSLSSRHPKMQVSITAGDRGSWVWDGKGLYHQDALEVDVVGTAGAGDAHFAGLVTGLIAGLTLEIAHQLAVLVGALSVTSPHTINYEIDRVSLAGLARRYSPCFADDVHALLIE
jgi:ribokinase